jgi:hypothetical protein
MFIPGKIRDQVKTNTGEIENINNRDNPVFERISSPALVGGGSSIPRASCTADAGDHSYITATLYNSDGTTGDAITVYCNISNGTALNASTPRLETGDDIFVTKSNYSSTVSRYYCVTNFMATEECTCS